MKVVIFVNGVLVSPERVAGLLDDAGRIICADGGARHCLALGLKPDLVIGDMDSLSDGDRERLLRLGADMDIHPREKDCTDLELALDKACQWEADHVLLLGAWGGRMDHALANLLLLAEHAGRDRPVLELYEEGLLCRVVSSGECHRFSGRPGSVVSALPLGGDCSGVTYEGLRYPLQDATLKMGSSRGMSNEMMGNEACVRIESGRLLIVREVE